MPSETKRLDAIREKVEAGKRLTFEDGLALEASNDLFALGSMADRCASGTTAISCIIMSIRTSTPPTCASTPRIARLRADLGEARAYVMDRDQIVERAAGKAARGATELHIVGGLYNKLPFDYYVDVALDQGNNRDPHQGLHGRRDRVVLQDHGSRSNSILKDLIDAGLGSLPAAASKSSIPEAREQICAPRPRPRAG